MRGSSEIGRNKSGRLGYSDPPSGASILTGSNVFLNKGNVKMNICFSKIA